MNLNLRKKRNAEENEMKERSENMDRKILQKRQKEEFDEMIRQKELEEKKQKEVMSKDLNSKREKKEKERKKIVTEKEKKTPIIPKNVKELPEEVNGSILTHLNIVSLEMEPAA